MIKLYGEQEGKLSKIGIKIIEVSHSLHFLGARSRGQEIERGKKIVFLGILSIFAKRNVKLLLFCE